MTRGLFECQEESRRKMTCNDRLPLGKFAWILGEGSPHKTCYSKEANFKTKKEVEFVYLIGVNIPYLHNSSKITYEIILIVFNLLLNNST